MSRRHANKSPVQFQAWKEEKALRNLLKIHGSKDPEWYERLSESILELEALKEKKDPDQHDNFRAVQVVKELQKLMQEKGVKL